MGWGLLLNLGRLATVGGRGAATGTGGVVVTQGGRTIAVEAAKGMATVVLAKGLVRIEPSRSGVISVKLIC